jgi:hypothetical protein
LDLNELQDLRLRLEQHMIFKASAMKTHISRKLSQKQLRSVLLGRAYYYQIYFLFFPETDFPPITQTELSNDILLNENAYLATPGCMSAQVLLRGIKLIRQKPQVFAKAVIQTYPTLILQQFAFLTFPALYQFFTAVESCNSASEFIQELISLRAPSELIMALLRSFLFATYPFIDAVWFNFHAKFCAKQRIDDMVAIQGLGDCIEMCAPLLPPLFPQIIQSFLNTDPEMCCRAVTDYLKVAFTLWNNHVAEAMSFGCGQSVVNFLDICNDFQAGHAITLVSRILSCKFSVVAYPSNLELCDMSSEAIVLSHFDIAVFRKAAEGADPPLGLNRAIDTEENMPRFTPYLLDYFATFDRRKRPVQVLRTLFDEDLFADVSGAKDPALKTSIMEYQHNLRELEEVFRMKLLLRGVRVFHGSLVRFRNAAFAEFCRRHLRTMTIGAKQMDKTAKQILGRSNEARSLMPSVLAELLNAIKLPEPESALLHSFWALKKEYLQSAWKEVETYKGFSYLIALVPAATRRSLSNFGDVFVLFSHVFWVRRQIVRYFKSSEQDSTKLMKFLSLSSEFGGILKVFLFFDKLVLQNEFFTSVLDGTLVADWNSFCRIMLVTVASNEKLFNAISIFAASDLPD